MNNEPVAWMVKAPDGEYLVFENTEHPVMADCEYIPLYTHPAKTLTDEEIKEVYGEYFDVENCDWLHLQCIQAILRKASE